MKLSGEVSLPAPPAAVWSLLTDPARLSRLLPGCERLEPSGPDRYKAVVKFALAAISGQYAGSLELSDKQPPRSLVLKLSGRGLPGFVAGEGRVELIPGPAGTVLRYAGDAQVGGMIATVGQRLLDVAAQKIVRQFFESAATELQSKAPASGTVAPSVEPPARHTEAAKKKKTKKTRK